MRNTDAVLATEEKSFIDEHEALAMHCDAALVTIAGIDAITRATLAQRLSAVHHDTVLLPYARSIFASHGVPQITAYHRNAARFIAY